MQLFTNKLSSFEAHDICFDHHKNEKYVNFVKLKLIKTF